jgi:ergothioneine biosynthesis protein EgtB
MNLLQYYKSVRAYTNQICQPLEVEDYTPQSVDFASPPKWHLAHTTWFYETIILKKYIKDYKVFDDSFSFLFNSYYNALGERLDRSKRGLITRPSISKVFKYREYIDGFMHQLLNKNNLEQEIIDLVTLGINHEQQHQELLITDIKYTLSCNPLYPKLYEENLVDKLDDNLKQKFIQIEEGIYQIGNNSDAFCYDNELGYHRVFLESFEISNQLVTNAEYLKFIEDDGYKNPKYWLDDGWTFINNKKITAPLYWKHHENSWMHYTLSGLAKIQLNAPVCHVSYYEAQAFANWSNKRLPTEFEWEIANEKFNWKERWEWTNSAYLAYPGYKVPEGATGEYNGKFMVNTMVLRGASCATSPNHTRHTYRNFFSPETRWQFSGIRLAI